MSEPLTPPATAEVTLRGARAELEQRLRGGEVQAAEAVLAVHPTLDADGALQLIYDEMIERERRGDKPSYEEYYRRFPEWRQELQRTFEIHETLVRTSPMPEPEPSPRYELIEEIGRGGMGIVYKARQPGLGRFVALKMIRAGEWAGPSEEARFRREAETAARLSHPNIVQIHEVGEQDGLPFLAMEYVDGGSLADRLRGAPLPATEAAQLVETLARAIQHAHQAGVVHRDLKPANVLLTSERQTTSQDASSSDQSPYHLTAPQVKIADFGLARKIDASGQSHSGAVTGTPSYMAPEQAEGKKEIGPAVDVWALGAILYECLTGRPPFRGETALETLMQVRSHEPVPPRQLRPELPRDLETVCLKCLNKEPGRRYAGAGELAEDLRRFRAGEPIRARPVGAVERVMKWVRRRPAVAGLLALLVGLTATALVLMGWQLRLTRGALDQAEASLAERDVALAHALWRGDDLPSARELLQGVPEQRRNEAWHEVHRACTAELYRLDAVPGGAYLGWSQDGRLLVSIGVGRATVWDGETGRLIHDIPLVAARAGYAAVINGPELTILYQSGRITPPPRDGGPPADAPADLLRLHLVRVDLGSGRHTHTLLPEQWLLSSLALSPTGRWLAVNKPSRDPAFASVLIMDVAARKPVRALSREGSGSPLTSMLFSPDEGRLVQVDQTQIAVWDGSNDRPATVAWSGFRYSLGKQVSPDGRLLACAGSVSVPRRQGRVWIWDLKTLRLLCEWSRPSVDGVFSAVFSPDGRLLAWEADNGVILLSEVPSGKEVFWLRRHQGSIHRLAFSPDGRRLASYSTDRTLRVWNVSHLATP